MDYQHIIEKGTLIYSSLPSDRKLRSWQIRESQCTVMFYEKEPLTDIETIILKLLYSCEGEEVTREELGMKLVLTWPIGCMKKYNSMKIVQRKFSLRNYWNLLQMETYC
jgi:hypothetical protein